MDSLRQRLGQMDIQSNYDKTLVLLAALKAGELTVDDFYLVPGGWQLGKLEPIEPEHTEAPPAILLTQADE